MNIGIKRCKTHIFLLLFLCLISVPAYADTLESSIAQERPVVVTIPDTETAIEICERNEEILGYEYWLDDGSIMVRYDWRLTTRLLYGIDVDCLPERAYEMERIAREVLSTELTADMSEYSKAYKLYCWVIAHSEYDYASSMVKKDRRHKSQLAETVFSDGTAVCAGLSDAYYYLCNLAGVECKLVRGYLHGAPHCWNVVNIDGVWYYADITSESFVFGTNWAAQQGYELDCYCAITVFEKNYVF